MLTVRQRMILDFEGRPYKYIGAKEQDIVDLFGVTPTHYYQELNQLIGTVEALAYAPMLVKRIRAKRTNRRNYGASTLTHRGTWEYQAHQAG